MNGQTRAQIAKELEAIPRGSLAQNLYRMIYHQARLNGLGSRPEIGPTSEDAHAFALQTVREQHPDFWPVLNAEHEQFPADRLTTRSEP
jgi:hypothetical protein